MPKGTYLASKVADHVLGGPNYTAPTTVYIALYTVAPISDGTGGTEVSAPSYSRVAMANDSTHWPAATAGAKSNGTLIAFPPAAESWGLIVAWAIKDNSSGGNTLYFNTVSASKSVLLHESAEFDIGELTITEE